MAHPYDTDETRYGVVTVRDESGTTLYQCLECGKKLTSKRASNWKDHMKTHDKNRERLKCPFCPSQFLRMGDYRRHYNIHLGKSELACESCNKLFSRPDHYARHTRHGCASMRAGQVVNSNMVSPPLSAHTPVALVSPNLMAQQPPVALLSPMVSAQRSLAVVSPLLAAQGSVAVVSPALSTQSSSIVSPVILAQPSLPILSPVLAAQASIAFEQNAQLWSEMSSPAFARPHNAPGNIMYQPYITHPLSPEFAQHIPGLQHSAFAYPFGAASTASYMQTPPMTPVARGNFVMAGRLAHARHFPSASSTSSIPDLEVLPSPALNATSPTLLATTSPALLATLPPHLRAQYAQLAQGMPHVQQLPGPIEQCDSPAVLQTIGARPLEEICLTDPVDLNWNENELLDEDS